MIEVPDDRCERHRLFMAIDEAFKAGDFERVGNALGGSPRWFDEVMPFELGLGHPLEYAIYWSPVAFIRRLFVEGTTLDYPDAAGFPAIIAALSTKRSDRLEIISLLLEYGADPNGRGINDWTPLHYAANINDIEAVGLLLEAGADPSLRTRIDQQETAAEEAERCGHGDVAALLRSANLASSE